MTSRVASVAPGDDLDAAMSEMDRLDVRHLPVVEHGRLVGVLSDRDLLAETGWLAPRQRELLEVPTREVRQVMHHSPEVAAPGDSVDALASRLAAARIGCLPVVEEEHLVGIVTETDVLAACRDQLGSGAAPEESDPPVSSAMSTEVVTVSPGAPAEEVAALLHERGFRHLPVVEDDRVVGIVSDRDIRRAIGRGELELTEVGRIMTKDVVCLDAEAHLSKAAALLAELPISCLPVTRDGKLEGVITVTDLLIAYARRLSRTS